jgi:hypothetical protein
MMMCFHEGCPTDDGSAVGPIVSRLTFYTDISKRMFQQFKPPPWLIRCNGWLGGLSISNYFVPLRRCSK